MKMYYLYQTLFVISLVILLSWPVSTVMEAKAMSRNRPRTQIQRQQQTNNLRNEINAELNLRNDVRTNSSSSSGVYNGDTIYPAIPQDPDHSNEIAPPGHFNWDIYYRSLVS